MEELHRNKSSAKYRSVKYKINSCHASPNQQGKLFRITTHSHFKLNNLQQFKHSNKQNHQPTQFKSNNLLDANKICIKSENPNCFISQPNTNLGLATQKHHFQQINVFFGENGANENPSNLTDECFETQITLFQCSEIRSHFEKYSDLQNEIQKCEPILNQQDKEMNNIRMDLTSLRQKCERELQAIEDCFTKDLSRLRRWQENNLREHQRAMVNARTQIKLDWICCEEMKVNMKEVDEELMMAQSR